MSWENWERSADKGPTGFLIRVFVTLFILGAVIGTIGYGMGWFSEAAAVAQKEFGAKGSLTKYEWFKDASNQLEAKAKDIDVYNASLKNLEEQYQGVPRKEWPRDDREAYNQKAAEVAGLKASYNGLVRDYNSQSEKFNWNYANTEGNVPRSYQEK